MVSKASHNSAPNMVSTDPAIITRKEKGDNTSSSSKSDGEESLALQVDVPLMLVPLMGRSWKKKVLTLRLLLITLLLPNRLKVWRFHYVFWIPRPMKSMSLPPRRAWDVSQKWILDLLILVKNFFS